MWTWLWYLSFQKYLSLILHPNFDQFSFTMLAIEMYLKLWLTELNQSDTFLHIRGTQQGDSMSPYLFVLCIDVWSHIISKQVKKGAWKAFKVGRNGPSISHLLFSNHCIKQCLQLFCSLSREIVSEAKTKVYFSNNVLKQMANGILRICEHLRTFNMSKYLGVSLKNGR